MLSEYYEGILEIKYYDKLIYYKMCYRKCVNKYKE